jgi:GNAT superfamily N-acetyltransferase
MNVDLIQPDGYSADLLAKFFVENVDETYISDADVEYGRALDGGRWVGNLDEVVRDELLSTRKQVWLAHEAGTTLGFAVVDNTQEWAVLEDIVLVRSGRSTGLGGAVLKRLMACVRHQGHAGMRCECGPANTRAHEFFQQHGFTPVAVQFKVTF